MINERSVFETRLESMFGAYADRAPVEVDASALASEIATARPRRVYHRLAARNRWLVPVLIGLLLIATLAATVYVASQLLTPRVIAYDEQFTNASDMSSTRVKPVVVALSDGRVLISQGADGSAGSIEAEVYDPETGESTPVAGDGPYGGEGMGALLGDDRVLVVSYSTNTTSSRAYLFDPESMSYMDVSPADQRITPVFGVLPTIASLDDGRALIAGGQDEFFGLGVRNEAVIYDPETGTFTRTGSMAEPRVYHAMTTLKDGRVLVAGGQKFASAPWEATHDAPWSALSTAELYDPTTGAFQPAGEMSTLAGAALSALLPDGRVAVISFIRPESSSFEPDATTFIEIYDPRTGAFTPAGSTDRHPERAIGLRDGRVLLTGADLAQLNVVEPGEYWDHNEFWAEIFDPKTGEFESVQAPRTELSGVTLLPDGRVLFAGGLAYPPLDENGNGTGEAFSTPWVDIFE